MLRLNAKCLCISMVVFNCLAVGGLVSADRSEQKKLRVLESNAGEVFDGSVSTGIARSVEQATPPGRLTIAVLWFEDKTGDPQMAHWRYAVTGLLTHQLWEAKAIRVLPVGAVDYAFREVGIIKGAALNAAQARKMGEHIEAQRIVWGSYRRQGEEWQAVTYVLNVASGKVSSELSASSADLFEVGDNLTEQILKELRIKPSEEERQKISRRLTTSTAALEWYSKVIALQDENEPLSEQEASVRKAIAADPEFSRAHLALAATLFSQGKFTEAEEAVSQALKIRPDYSDAHALLGILLTHQKKFAEAEQELREANRLDPDDSRALIHLGELYSTKGKWDEAITFLDKARLLDPTKASIHADLGLMYVRKRDRNKAMVELKEAERLLVHEGLQSINAEQMICQAYELLGDIPLAVEHYERFVALAKKKGLNPKAISAFEKKAQELKATLTISFIEASMPKIYTERSLQAVLTDRLTKRELEIVTNPVASSEEMKRWAQQLTEGVDSNQDKANVLFDALRRRIQPEGGRGARTAQEVFAAWSDPNESFSCQEYAKLYLALTREVNIETFYVHVEKDYRGKIVFHDCAAVFAQGKALLVDPAYRWFGVPHKDFVILDDVQTIAHHFFQHRRTSRDVSRCRLASKLHPDFAWGQLCLAGALLSADQTEDARKALEVAIALEPGRWDAYLLQGILAGKESNFDAAEVYLRKALELNPEDADGHYFLGMALLAQGKVEEAREEYRACLRYKPEPETAEKARREIAQINEAIGVEPTSGPSSAEAYSIRAIAYYNKGRYDQAISDLTKIIEMDPADAEAYSNRGAVYFKTGEFDKAVSDFNKALEIGPDDAEVYSNRGAVYVRISEFDKAVSDFNKALEINPRYAGAYNNRGLAYCNKERYDQAISDFNKALEINPMSAEAYSNRAKAYLKKGLNDQAISDCNKALEINPRLADAYRNRGFARKAKGDYDGAISDFNKFQELSK